MVRLQGETTNSAHPDDTLPTLRVTCLTACNMTVSSIACLFWLGKIILRNNWFVS